MRETDNDHIRPVSSGLVTKKKSKRQQVKEARLKGDAYASEKSGKIFQERHTPKPHCNSTYCSKKGFGCELLSEERCLNILRTYYSLSSLQEQRSWLARHLTSTTPTFHKENSRKSCTISYFLPIDEKGDTVRVCRSLFTNTLQVTDRQVRTVISKLTEVGIVYHLLTVEMDRLGVLRTSEDNTSSFIKVFNSETSLDSFLRGEYYVPLHSTNLDALEQEVLAELTYDIDGLVFEMSKLSSLKLPLSIVHLNVARNIIEIYHKVKKHFRLTSYSCNWHRALKVCKGIVVARALGYEVVVALCPVLEFTCRRFSAQDIKAYQLLFFKSLKENAEKVMGSISMQVGWLVG